MSRYIDANAFEEALETADYDVYSVYDGDGFSYRTVIDVLNRQPAADVRENVHGEWLTWADKFHPGENQFVTRWLGVFCSACGLHADNMSDYCPNCGADMRGERDE